MLEGGMHEALVAGPLKRGWVWGLESFQAAAEKQQLWHPETVVGGGGLLAILEAG